MGSFTEVVLDFDFGPDVPDSVLAAFSRLAGPSDPAVFSQPVPTLPEPVDEPAASWDPVMQFEEERVPDEEQWTHDWSGLVSAAMGVQTVPYAQLTWTELDRWHLSARFSWKTDPDGVAAVLAWLAPFIEVDEASSDYPRLLGYAHHEYAPRPHLLWCRAGVLEAEDLNPDDEWVSGSPTPNVSEPPASPVVLTRLVTVQGLPGSGKTHYLAELAAKNPDWVVVDDYYTGNDTDEPNPLDSRYFGTVVRAIREGRTTVVSDIRFCSGRAASEFVESVAEVAPAQWWMTSFHNDPEACRRNLEARAAREGRDLDRDLRDLAERAEAYYPAGTPRPVWSPT